MKLIFTVLTFIFLNLNVLSQSPLIYPKFDIITTSNNIGHQYGFYTNELGLISSADDLPSGIKFIIDEFDLDLGNLDFVRLQYQIDSLNTILKSYESLKYLKSNNVQINGVNQEILDLYNLLREIPIYKTQNEKSEELYNKSLKILTGQNPLRTSMHSSIYFGFDAEREIFIPLNQDEELISNLALNEKIFPQLILFPDAYLNVYNTREELNCFNCSSDPTKLIFEYKKLRKKIIKKVKSELFKNPELVLLTLAEKLELLYEITGLDDNYFLLKEQKEASEKNFNDLKTKYIYKINNDYYYFGQLNEQSKPQGFGQLITTDHRLVFRAIWEDGFPTQILDVYFYDNIKKVNLTKSFGNYKLDINVNNEGTPYLLLGGFNGVNFNGECEFFFGSNEKYSGDYISGYRTGQGLYCWEVGYYRGEWLDNKLHGKGEWLYTDSTYYSGELYYGTRQGYGTFKFKNGDQYEGSFKAGTYDGFGKFTSSNGKIIYEGNYKEGKYDGKGKLAEKYTDNYYVGNFKNGKFEGWGEYYYSHRKETYRGNWVAGARQGYGELYNLDGVVIERGDYINGAYQPPVEIRQTEIANNLTTTGNCSFQFKKPTLKIKWIDNRRSCCNYDCKNYASYTDIKKKNLLNQEQIYLTNILEAHFIECDADENHKIRDREKLTKYLNENYYNSSNPLESMLGLTQSMALSSGMAYQITSRFESSMGISKTKSQRIQELKNTNFELNLYETSKYCSDKCKNISTYYGHKCN
jgi:hypothetical protein